MLLSDMKGLDKISRHNCLLLCGSVSETIKLLLKKQPKTIRYMYGLSLYHVILVGKPNSFIFKAIPCSEYKIMLSPVYYNKLIAIMKVGNHLGLCDNMRFDLEVPPVSGACPGFLKGGGVQYLLVP